MPGLPTIKLAVPFINTTCLNMSVYVVFLKSIHMYFAINLSKVLDHTLWGLAGRSGPAHLGIRPGSRCFVMRYAVELTCVLYYPQQLRMRFSCSVDENILTALLSHLAWTELVHFILEAF